jgi:mono/diheme cytochrome c family protein
VIPITALSSDSAILCSNTLLFKGGSRVQIGTGSSGLFARHCLGSDAAAVFHQRNWTEFGVLRRDSRRSRQTAESREAVARVHHPPKKWWAMDCEMCHNKSGDGKGDTAKEMKLPMMDFINPDTLKDRTDGEVFYIIKNGHNNMPAEGPRVKAEEAWDLVNYVRAFAKKKDADPKAQ